MGTVVLTVLGLYNLALGLRLLVTRRPLLYPSGRTFWLFAFAFTLLLVQQAGSVITTRHVDLVSIGLDMMSVAVLLFFGFVLSSMKYLIRGYDCLGIDEDAFRDTLRHALTQAGLPFDERISKIKLPTLSAELHVSAPPGMGSAHVSISPRGQHAALMQLANSMTHDWGQSPPRLNRRVAKMYVLMGLFMLSISLGSSILDLSLRALRLPL